MEVFAIKNEGWIVQPIKLGGSNPLLPSISRHFHPLPQRPNSLRWAAAAWRAAPLPRPAAAAAAPCAAAPALPAARPRRPATRRTRRRRRRCRRVFGPFQRGGAMNNERGTIRVTYQRDNSFIEMLMIKLCLNLSRGMVIITKLINETHMITMFE